MLVEGGECTSSLYLYLSYIVGSESLNIEPRVDSLLTDLIIIKNWKDL